MVGQLGCETVALGQLLTEFVHRPRPQRVEVLELSPGIDGEERIRGTVQDVTGRRQAEAQVEYLESFDKLTRLPNRTFLRDRIGRLAARSRKEGSLIGVICLDLDRFDRVRGRSAAARRWLSQLRQR